MTFRITPFKHKPLEVSEAFSCVELDSLLAISQKQFNTEQE